MIAYCPVKNSGNNICGVKNMKERNIELTDADTEATPKKISITKDSGQTLVDARDESCWWTVSAPKVDSGKSSTKTIHIKTTKMNAMEAYAYGGDSKATALKPVNKGNVPLSAGEHQVYYAA